jgi:hypothetical protein
MNEKQTPMEYRSTEELEQLLQQEGETMPAEQLLELLDELASRKPNTADTDAAWQRFQSDYMTMEPEKPRTAGFWRRGFAVAAAALVLVVGLSVTVGAIGGRNLWQAVVSWTEDRFTMSGSQLPQEQQKPINESEVPETFYEWVEEATGMTGLTPAVIPEGFELLEMERTEDPGRIIHHASYQCGERHFQIHVETCFPEEPIHVEKDETPVEIYTGMDVDCYIVQNTKTLVAIWRKDGYQCLINGSLTREELMMMLDSV